MPVPVLSACAMAVFFLLSQRFVALPSSEQAVSVRGAHGCGRAGRVRMAKLAACSSENPTMRGARGEMRGQAGAR